MKRIVICADGTWNIRDQMPDTGKTRHPTNVTKVARAVKPRSSSGVDQIVFYDEGVGTNGGIDKYTGGAFGRGMEGNIRAFYRSIIYNYQQGDELYFFGFSRGAFTVRSLIGFMNCVGVIDKDGDYYVPELYACYEHNERQGTKRWEKAFHRIKVVAPCPPIRFVGVWDTVGALGAPGFLGKIFNRKKYQYHDVGLFPAVENAYHALAIDEQRKPFMPSVWKRPNGWSGKLEQVWFAGVHSNVGGGYAPDGLANEALHWMVEKAEGHGLEFDSRFLAHFKPCYDSIICDSMTAFYKIMGRGSRQIGGFSADGEGIHQSALDRKQTQDLDYTPRNLGDAGALAKVRTVNTTRVARRPCRKPPGS